MTLESGCVDGTFYIGGERALIPLMPHCILAATLNPAAKTLNPEP